MKIDEDSDSLDKVEQISKIIAEINSKDISTSSNAIHKAEQMLKNLEQKKELNKTMINKTPALSGNTPALNSHPQQMEVNAFKMMVEKDAAERRERKEKERKKATTLKIQANEFYKVGDLEKAVELYSQAIQASKDWSILYTNRAQAYLRLGKPDKALSDCDVALQILPWEPVRTATNLGEEAQNAREMNLKISKAQLLRGKALVALRRPTEAMKAYSGSRTFMNYSKNPAINESQTEDNDKWPLFLRDYVTQAKAAISAENIDSKTKDLLSLRFTENDTEISMTFLLEPNEQNFLRLIAELAADGHDLKEYTVSLIKLVRLLNSAVLETEKADQVTAEIQNAGDKQDVSLKEPISVADVKVKKGNRQKRKREAKAISKNCQSPNNGDKNGINTQSKDDGDTVGDPNFSLQRLQSFFRLKNGFEAIKRQMEFVNSINTLRDLYKGTSEQIIENEDNSLLSLFHLRALLMVSFQLCLDCGENQRLLIDTMPQLFSNVLMDCLEICPKSTRLSNLDKVLPLDSNYPNAEISPLYVMDDIRFSACELLALLSSDASGREALLVYPGPARLLSSLASCLSDVLGLPKLPETQLFGRVSPSNQKQVSDNSIKNSSFAVQTVAAISRILENLTKSPHFLSLMRSSDCFTSLQDVVEAALSTPSTSTSATNVASAFCLSLLMDSLSTACQDVALRRRLISKRNFVKNLAGCLLLHAPLTADDNHVALVGSVCRLLHNCVTGENSPPLDSEVLDILLVGLGIVLDLPSRGTTVLSVIIVLLGKILPMCSLPQVEKWCKFGDMVEVDHSRKSHAVKPHQTLTKRISILISIVRSYSVSVLHAAGQPTIDNEGKAYESEESLEGHRLRGAIRALAIITKAPGCQDVCFAIGDDRLTTRRLACLVRARAAHPNGVPLSVGASIPPRDEPLAANVCLILQNCVQDTPLAENLEGTSILMDLFKLIEESSRTDTKRNAAIFAGKLASSSHVHRDVFSRLKGFNILSPFHQWTRASDAPNF